MYPLIGSSGETYLKLTVSHLYIGAEIGQSFEWYLWQKNVADEGFLPANKLWKAGRGITHSIEVINRRQKMCKFNKTITYTSAPNVAVNTT